MSTANSWRTAWAWSATRPLALTSSGPVPYDDYDAHRPLEAGMVVSIGTTMKHPTRGFIKLEDTVAVTPTGYEIFGQSGRGWNLRGTGR